MEQLDPSEVFRQRLRAARQPQAALVAAPVAKPEPMDLARLATGGLGGAGAYSLANVVARPLQMMPHPVVKAIGYGIPLVASAMGAGATTNAVDSLAPGVHEALNTGLHATGPAGVALGLGLGAYSLLRGRKPVVPPTKMTADLATALQAAHLAGAPAVRRAASTATAPFVVGASNRMPIPAVVPPMIGASNRIVPASIVTPKPAVMTSPLAESLAAAHQNRLVSPVAETIVAKAKAVRGAAKKKSVELPKAEVVPTPAVMESVKPAVKITTKLEAKPIKGGSKLSPNKKFEPLRTTEINAALKQHGPNAEAELNKSLTAAGGKPLSQNELDYLEITRPKIPHAPVAIKVKKPMAEAEAQADAFAMKKSGKAAKAKQAAVEAAQVVEPEPAIIPGDIASRAAAHKLEGTDAQLFESLANGINNQLAKAKDLPERVRIAKSIMSGENRHIRAALRTHVKDTAPDVHTEMERLIAEKRGTKAAVPVATETPVVTTTPSPTSEHAPASADEVLSIIKQSPNQPADRNWDKFAQHFGVEGDFSKGVGSVEQLKNDLQSGHLRMSGSVDQAVVDAKAASGKLNPVIITKEPGRQMVVVDGSHSLRAAIKRGDTDIPVVVSNKVKDRVLPSPKTQPPTKEPENAAGQIGQQGIGGQQHPNGDGSGQETQSSSGNRNVNQGQSQEGQAKNPEAVPQTNEKEVLTPKAEVVSKPPKSTKPKRRTEFAQEPTGVQNPYGETPDGKTYSAAKSANTDSIVLLKKGNTYEAFGGDAEELGKIGVNVSTLDKNSKNPIKIAGIPQDKLQSHVAELEKNGKKVHIAGESTKKADTHKLVMDALHAANPHVAKGDLADTGDVIEHLQKSGMSRPEAEKALHDMFVKKKIVLTGTGGQMSTEAERARMMRNPEGGYFNTASIWQG